MTLPAPGFLLVVVVDLSSGAMSADPQQAWYSWPKWAESLRTHTRSALQSHCGNILLLCSVPLARLALASATFLASADRRSRTVKFLLDQKRRISLSADVQNKTGARDLSALSFVKWECRRSVLPECIVDPSTHDVNDVKPCECEKQLVEHVTQLGSGEDHQRHQVADKANDPDDRHQDAVEPKSEKRERRSPPVREKAFLLVLSECCPVFEHRLDSLTHRLVVRLLITSHPDSLRRRSQSTRSLQD